jgi:hypothetical protein
MIVKQIRCRRITTYCIKSLPHQISQIGTTIMTALTMVIRIKLSSINQLSGDGLNNELQWSM